MKMLTNKKKSSRVKKRKIVDTASLYTEDIGTAGIKQTSYMSMVYSQPSISDLPLSNDEDERRQQRMQRFGKVSPNGEPDAMLEGLVASRGDLSSKSSKKKRRKSSTNAIVGTSTALEKPYLRLTDFPKPEDVRPLPMLKKALAHIKTEYLRAEDFEWTNEQLKSLRQDLTVQHIRNEFVLEVYETHARVLLENGDLNEFHQCQTMLRSLTSPSAVVDQEMSDASGDDFRPRDKNQPEVRLKQKEENADEFLAYGILYNLVQESWGEMNLMLATSKEPVCEGNNGKLPKCLRGHSVRHALKVVDAVMHDDYQSFFRLYKSPPHLSAYLMDFVVQRVRKSAYARIIAAYRPSVSVEHFRVALFFPDLEDTRRFLKSHGCIFIHELGAPPFFVDCKATFLATSKVPVRR